MSESSKGIEQREDFWEAVKKFPEAIFVVLLDTFNTSTPPGLEYALWAEFINLGDTLFMREYILKVQIPRLARSFYSDRLARGIMREEGHCSGAGFMQISSEVRDGVFNS